MQRPPPPDRATPLALSIDSRILKAKFAGEGAIGETPMLSGEIDATSPSARELATWLGFGDSVPTTAGAITLKATTDRPNKIARDRIARPARCTRHL